MSTHTEAVLDSRSSDVRIELLRALADLGGEASTRDVRRRINQLRDKGEFLEEKVTAVNSRKANYHLKGMSDDGLLKRLESTDQSGLGSGALRFQIAKQDAVDEILSRTESYDELREAQERQEELDDSSPTLQLPAEENVDVENLAEQLQTALPRVRIEIIENHNEAGGADEADEVDTNKLKRELTSDLLALLAELHTESEVREAQERLR